MSQKRRDSDEQKFDMIHLLQGVEASDLSLEEIMNEFGGWTVKPAPLTAGGKPHVEERKPVEPEPPELSEPPEPPRRAAGTAEDPVPAQSAKRKKPAAAASAAAAAPAGNAVQASAASAAEPPNEATRKVSRFHFVELDLNKPPQEQAAERFSTPAPDAPLPASPVPNSAQEGQPFGASVRSSRVILPEEEAPESPPQAKERKKKHRSQPAAEPVRPEPTVPGALRFYGKAVKRVRARMMPALLLSILAAVLTVAAVFDWPLLPVFEKAANRNMTLIALQVLTALLCFDVAARGVYDLFRLRFAMEGLAMVANVLILVEAALKLNERIPPFCAVGCFVMTMTLWGSLQKKVAMRRSLKTLSTTDTPTDVRRVSGLWEEGPCIVKTAGSPDGFILDMEKPDRVDTAMGVYGPVLLAATLVIAVLLRTRWEISFLWTWTALVCAGLPLAGGICFGRPWALLSRRLLRRGAAISGWHGVKALSGARGVTILDSDLFPAGSVNVSGMKLFGPFRADLVVSYAASLIVPLGGSLAPLFRKLQEEQGSQWFQPSGLRAFEGGGIGGDIRGDVVQVGSMSFMQLMGVRLPKGTNVRQAVYVSINGELAGLFAISYQKAKGVQQGLRAMGRQRELRTVFAMRDFLMSPGLLRQLFGLSPDGVEYPRVEVRLELSQPLDGSPGVRGAVLTREELTAYADVACGAVRLRSSTRRNLLLSMLGGILGVGLLTAALILGLDQAAVPAAALVYGLVWCGILAVASVSTVRF